MTDLERGILLLNEQADIQACMRTDMEIIKSVQDLKIVLDNLLTIVQSLQSQIDILNKVIIK